MKYCPACKANYPDSERFCPTEGRRLSFPDPYHLVGRTLLEKYRIDALVGLGGMGAVYSAHHLTINRHIAIKILQPNLVLGNERVIELFQREAEMADRPAFGAGIDEAYILEHETLLYRPWKRQRVLGRQDLRSDVEEGEKIVEPLRKFGQPIADVVGPTPFAGFQQAFDPLLTPGARNYWKSHNFRELPDEAIDMIIDAASKLPSPLSEIFIGNLGGAVNRRTTTPWD